MCCRCQRVSPPFQYHRKLRVFTLYLSHHLLSKITFDYVLALLVTIGQPWTLNFAKYFNPIWEIQDKLRKQSSISALTFPNYEEIYYDNESTYHDISWVVLWLLKPEFGVTRTLVMFLSTSTKQQREFTGHFFQCTCYLKRYRGVFSAVKDYIFSVFSW